MARVKTFAFGSLLPVLLALAPVQVLAQTTNPAVTAPLEARYAGESLNGKARLIIPVQQCEQTSGGTLTFSAKYNTQIPVLEGWIGKGSTDCSSQESRTRASSSSLSAACRRVFLLEESTTQLAFEIHPHDLFWTHDPSASHWPETTEDTASGDPGSSSTSPGPGCDRVTNQVYTLYFLALNQATDLRGNTSYAVLTHVNVLKAAFTLYTKRPDAPTALVGADGRNALTFTFATVPGAFPATRYRAYFDWGTGADECGSGALQAGQSAPADSESVTSVDAQIGETRLGEATLRRLGSKGIEIGDSVAASVVTIDPAGSESLLAAPICVTRRVAGSDPGVQAPEPDDSLLCSLRPGARENDAWGGGLLLVAALTFVTRRRS